MTDALKTYTELGVPSMALARAALQLAADRKWPGVRIVNGAKPVTRSRVLAHGSNVLPLSAEYYRIIDRIAAGENP